MTPNTKNLYGVWHRDKRGEREYSEVWAESAVDAWHLCNRHRARNPNVDTSGITLVSGQQSLADLMRDEFEQEAAERAWSRSRWDGRL